LRDIPHGRDSVRKDGQVTIVREVGDDTIVDGLPEESPSVIVRDGVEAGLDDPPLCRSSAAESHRLGIALEPLSSLLSMLWIFAKSGARSWAPRKQQ